MAAAVVEATAAAAAAALATRTLAMPFSSYLGLHMILEGPAHNDCQPHLEELEGLVASDLPVYLSDLSTYPRAMLKSASRTLIQLVSLFL